MKKRACVGCGVEDKPLGKVVTSAMEIPGSSCSCRTTSLVCSPACAARVLARVAFSYERDVTTGGVLSSDLQVGLWEAVNAYAEARGADMQRTSDRIMDAVVAVEFEAGGRARGPARTLAKSDGSL